MTFESKLFPFWCSDTIQMKHWFQMGEKNQLKIIDKIHFKMLSICYESSRWNSFWIEFMDAEKWILDRERCYCILRPLRSPSNLRTANSILKMKVLTPFSNDHFEIDMILLHCCMSLNSKEHSFHPKYWMERKDHLLCLKPISFWNVLV